MLSRIDYTPQRRRRSIGVAAAAAMAGVGLAYWLTIEPAPRVRVMWRPDLPASVRQALEEKYLLVNGRDRFETGSLAYDLLDTSPKNIRALVQDAAVADTNDIDRDRFVIPFATDYGERWMWIAHRTPGLRVGWLRAGLFILLTSLAVWGLRADAMRAAALGRAALSGQRKQG